MTLVLKLITLFVLLATLSSCNTDFGVRECIKKLSDGADIMKICKTIDNRSCFNSYYSMTLCLANN